MAEGKLYYQRDILGRLIYEFDEVKVMTKWSDTFYTGWVCDCYEYYTEDDFFFVDEPSVETEEDFHFLLGDKDMKFLVDLEKSPKMSNYKRYFADLGSLSVVIRAFYDSCCNFELTSSSGMCPFSSVEGTVTPWRDCFHFVDWLGMETEV